MGIDPQRANIKATTTEGLGHIGRGDGIAAMCIVLLAETKDS
jgi:2-C-methyl-D-erythritol 2,4-cyclodiphosphate synthase